MRKSQLIKTFAYVFGWSGHLIATVFASLFYLSIFLIVSD